MFGILYKLFCLGSKKVGQFQDLIYDSKNKTEAKANQCLTYFSKQGERLISDDRLVRRKKDENGDRILVDFYSGEVIYNFSEQHRGKEDKSALNNGETVVYDAQHGKNARENINKEKYGVGAYYRDIKTGKYYSRVTINKMSFYMDGEGKLVRLADGETCKYNDTGIEYDVVISLINRRQRMLHWDSRYNKSYFWMHDFYYMNRIGYRYTLEHDGKLHVYYSGSHNEADEWR